MANFGCGFFITSSNHFMSVDWEEIDSSFFFSHLTLECSNCMGFKTIKMQTKPSVCLQDIGSSYVSSALIANGLTFSSQSIKSNQFTCYEQQMEWWLDGFGIVYMFKKKSSKRQTANTQVHVLAHIPVQKRRIAHSKELKNARKWCQIDTVQRYLIFHHIGQQWLVIQPFSCDSF